MSASSQGLRVLAITAMYPTPKDPARGAFVKAQIESLRPAGVECEPFVLPAGGGVRGYMTAIPRIREAVTKMRPHLVHAHYGLAGWSAMWQRTPLVTSFCGDDLLGTPAAGGGLTARSRAGMALSQHAALRSRGIVCKSEQLRSRILSPAARARAVVIPNGVDGARFHPGSRAEARAALDLDPAERIVLFPNTPTERRKRLDLAEAAMERLRQQVPSARLVIAAGKGHAAMPSYYRAADVVLLTSEWEGSPNVVKEALMSGTPVVSTDVGDVREWILPDNGRVVARDPEAIAQGLAAMLCAPPRVDVEALRERLSASVIAARLVAYYHHVLGGASG